MGAVISIEEIFKCAHMKTTALYYRCLPACLPSCRHPPLWIWEELKPFPTTTAYTVYTNFPIRQSPSENIEGYQLDKSCHSTLPFSLKCPHATPLTKKNNVIFSQFFSSLSLKIKKIFHQKYIFHLRMLFLFYYNQPFVDWKCYYLAAYNETMAGGCEILCSFFERNLELREKKMPSKSYIFV